MLNLHILVLFLMSKLLNRTLEVSFEQLQMRKNEIKGLFLDVHSVSSLSLPTLPLFMTFTNIFEM